MTKLDIPETAYAFGGSEPNYVKTSSLPLIVAKQLREMADRLLDAGNRASNNAELSADYAAGYAQACFDADAMLQKQAEGLEDAH